ncbi:unnamed protein product [Callosobruchus maculatus]|uniref:DUF243 domain-containing protein n=1 Tax=Callosobruchus maculatus TaxID=64391 RepID=A0A653C339_CALMS|nr:unnamed protein product [Callosobruchus maculatus]
MRPFVFITALVAVVSARPEPPSGYSYSAPVAVPSSQYGSPSAHSGFSSQASGYSGQASGFSGHSAGGFSGHSAGGFGGQSAGGFSGHSAGGFGGQGAASFGQSSFRSNGFGASAGGGDIGGFSSGFGGGFAASAPATVHKHVYVHVAPEEPEERRPQRILSTPAAQKHYKIIFIKAPTPPTPTAPVIPVQPQNEEKTLVYVLVKKPEEQPEINIPTPAPTQPSKPEVYFIKYNTRKEAGAGAGAGAGFGGTGSGQDLGGGDAGLDSVSIEANSAHGAGGFSGDTHGALSGGASTSAGVSSKYGPPGYQH